MTKLRYNSKNVDRSKQVEGEYKPPRPGVYEIVVESVEIQKKNTDHPDRVVIKSKMTETDPEGNGKNYGFWNYVNLDESQDWVLDQWLLATGAADPINNPEGEWDTKDLVGKRVMGRVKSEFYGQEYRPKLGRVFSTDGTSSSNDDGPLDTGESEVDADAAETQDVGDLSEYTAEDIAEHGSLADQGDETSATILDYLGREAGLDPNDYPTWEELANVIVESMVPEEKPEPVKAAAKKAGAKPAAKKEPEPDAGEDYDAWSLDDINAELTARGLATGGPKSAKVARLRANDADPFSE